MIHEERNISYLGIEVTHKVIPPLYLNTVQKRTKKKKQRVFLFRVGSSLQKTTLDANVTIWVWECTPKVNKEYSRFDLKAGRPQSRLIYCTRGVSGVGRHCALKP